MSYTIRSTIFASLMTVAFSTARAQEPAAPQDVPTSAAQTQWGTLQLDPQAGWAMATINAPADSVALPTPMPNITRALLGTPAWPGSAMPFSFNSDATEITLHLPQQFSERPQQVVLEISEESRQTPDGRIILSAMDAVVDGQTARLETHPGSHRIGFWSNAADVVRWTYPATRPGMYDVFMTYSAAGESGTPGSEIEVSIADSVLSGQLKSTGSWYRYDTLSLGSVYLPQKGDCEILVKCKNLVGSAVMNLKALTLVPRSEGQMPTQADDGSIRLHARDVTVNGVLLQWEPREEKQTLGFWANANDSAFWDFQVSEAGTFAVEILQGCGSGQGGSTVEFSFFTWGSEDPAARLQHTVKDTGHWQAFEPFSIGMVTLPAGKARLRVRAKNKAGVAVMDLRQVLLTPTK